MIRVCTKCLKERPLEDFYNNKSKPGGKQSRCRDCHNDAIKAWYRKNPDKRRHNGYLTKYGITEKDVVRMEKEQDGYCAICARPFSPECKPYVDHCHETEMVRGLVCSDCNRGLGGFRDNPESMRAAADYIEAVSSLG